MVKNSFSSKRNRGCAGDLFGDSLYKIVDKYIRRMAGKFFSIMSDDDVNDLVHDTYMKVVDKKEKYDESRSLEGWVFRICQNSVRDCAKAIGKRKEQIFAIDEGFDDDETGIDIDHSPILIDWTYTADKPIMSQESEEEIWGGINSLNDEGRNVAKMVMDDMTYDVMADRLDCSEATARVKVCRIRKELRTMGIGA